MKNSKLFDDRYMAYLKKKFLLHILRVLLWHNIFIISYPLLQMVTNLILSYHDMNKNKYNIFFLQVPSSLRSIEGGTSVCMFDGCEQILTIVSYCMIAVWSIQSCPFSNIKSRINYHLLSLESWILSNDCIVCFLQSVYEVVVQINWKSSSQPWPSYWSKYFRCLGSLPLHVHVPLAAAPPPGEQQKLHNKITQFWH